MIIQKIMSQPHAFSNKKIRSGGYVALTSVLVVSAIGALVALTLLSTGVSYQLNSFVLEQKYNAEALAFACVNQALGQIRLNAGYSGSESLDFENGDCDILPITEDSGIYTILVEGRVGDIVRKSEVTVLREEISEGEDPEIITVTMTLQSWRRVADF